MRDKLCPECRWVPVVDAKGRRRLEMRWDPPAAAFTPSLASSARVARAA